MKNINRDTRAGDLVVSTSDQRFRPTISGLAIRDVSTDYDPTIVHPNTC